MSITLEGPPEDLAVLAKSHPTFAYSEIHGATGLEVARLIIDQLAFQDIAGWVAQGLVVTEITKRIATNTNTTIKEAVEIYTKILSILRQWSRRDDRDYVIWDGERIVLSNEMPQEKRQRFLETLGINHDDH